MPEYDPWLVYGAPVAIYPGWAPFPGLYVTGPDVWFGLGFGIGIFGVFAWGWHHWGADWHRHDVVFNHNTFVSRSPTFINRTSVYRGLGSANIYRGSGVTGREPVDIYRGHTEVARPAPNYYGAPHGSAFSGFDHGGITGAYSYRGMSSYGGGFDSHPGGFYFARPGGGGFHGGGGRR